ncbi:MAG: serine/threonine protein kinase [Thermoguttaceae bacterium]|nr:serine/threonine protein kinase [Thermoguttaceae bacterium]
MAVQSTSALLKVLEKSALLTTEEFEAVKQEALDAPEQFNTPEKLAKHWIQTNLLTKWQVMQLLSGKAAFFLGKYKLLNLLGVGGMGRVFLAEHTIMHRKVALKVISKEFSKNPEALKQFQAEARAIATLNHINIVQAYNFESEGDRFYIVMEYVDGQSLEKRVLKEGPLPINDVVSYLRQSAKALRHAHQRNMIHCDIKPDNLLLNQDGQIKILDMGIAKLNDPKKKSQAQESEPKSDSQVKKDESNILGTVDYLAPEMASGEAQADPRVDIYSLGCTMFFLLTGQVPYPETTLIERILAHQEKPPRDPRELRPDTPKELAYIILKMEEKKPEDRYQSMDEVLAALDASFPESTDLNIMDSAPVPDIERSGVNSAANNSAAWSTNVSAAGDTKNTNSKRSDSFDFLSGTGISTSGSNLHPSHSAADNHSKVIDKKTAHSKVGKKTGTGKKKSGGAPLANMPMQTKIIIGAAIGAAVLILALVLVFTSGSSDSKTTAPKSAPASEAKSDASADKAEKNKNEADTEENPVDLDNLNYEYDPNQWNDNPEEEGATPDANNPPAENN